MIMMITMLIRLRLQACVRPGSGRMLTYVWNQLAYLRDATQQPGLWAAHRTRGVDVLSACYCLLASRLSRRCIKRKYITVQHRKKQTGRKEIISTAGRERRREGGRKDDRKQETTA